LIINFPNLLVICVFVVALRQIRHPILLLAVSILPQKVIVFFCQELSRTIFDIEMFSGIEDKIRDDLLLHREETGFILGDHLPLGFLMFFFEKLKHLLSVSFPDENISDPTHHHRAFSPRLAYRPTALHQTAKTNTENITPRVRLFLFLLSSSFSFPPPPEIRICLFSNNSW
jgi:hypothetical protein